MSWLILHSDSLLHCYYYSYYYYYFLKEKKNNSVLLQQQQQLMMIILCLVPWKKSSAPLPFYSFVFVRSFLPLPAVHIARLSSLTYSAFMQFGKFVPATLPPRIALATFFANTFGLSRNTSAASVFKGSSGLGSWRIALHCIALHCIIIIEQ